MPTAPHAMTQRWARAIVEAFPDLDGVHHNSRFAGKPCVAPAQPLVSLTLTHPDVGGRLAATARRIGYQVI